MVWNGIKPMKSSCFFTIDCLFQSYTVSAYVHNKGRSPEKKNAFFWEHYAARKKIRVRRHGHDKYQLWKASKFQQTNLRTWKQNREVWERWRQPLKSSPAENISLIWHHVDRFPARLQTWPDLTWEWVVGTWLGIMLHHNYYILVLSN